MIGAGAIGCLVGGRLALAHESVTIVGRPAFAAAVRTRGLRMHDEEGERIADGRLTVWGSLAEAFAETSQVYDVAVLTVKSYDTAAAIAELSRVSATPPPVLSLQNGVGNEEALAAQFGPDAVIAGTLTTPVSVLAPGEIRVERPSYTFGLSAWSAGVSSTVMDAMQYALIQAGFHVKGYPSPQGMKWTKLIMNMVGNATSAILDAQPGALFAQRDLVDLEIEAWRETLRVMTAQHIHPINLGSYPLRWLGLLMRVTPQAFLRYLLREEVISARGDKWPSLAIDLSSGKGRTEIDWLNGAVASRGAALGIATPVNHVLTATVQQLCADPSLRAGWRENVPRLVEAVRRARRSRG